MITLREAAQQALEALEYTGMNVGKFNRVNAAITALKAALAEPQQPVAWMFQHEETGRTMCVDAQQVEWGFEKGNPRLKKIAPLYTHFAPQRQPLTEKEIEAVFSQKRGDTTEQHLIGCARAIERAHGIGGQDE